MKHRYNYSLTEINEMIPFEMTVYTDLTVMDNESQLKED